MKRYFVIIATVLIGYILQILPLPDAIQLFRPNWVAIILIYWSMALPDTVRLIFAFIAGLIMDVLLGTLLAQHSLAFVIIVYINLFFNLRIRVLSLGRQAIYVFALLLINQFIIVWIEGMTGSNPEPLAYVLPAITGMVIWPWAYIVLRDIRRSTML